VSVAVGFSVSVSDTPSLRRTCAVTSGLAMAVGPVKTAVTVIWAPGGSQLRLRAVVSM
jgi:hypothetical protein